VKKLAVVAVSALVASCLSLGQVQAPNSTVQDTPPIANESFQTDSGKGKISTFYSHARQVLVTVGVWKYEARSAAWVPNEILRRIPIAAEYLATPPVARGLAVKDFHIFDNGAEQKINYLEESDFPWRDVNRQWFFLPHVRGTWGAFFFGGLAIAAPTASYIIGYTPSLTQADDCHTIRVLSVRNDVVLNRDRYCNPEEGETSIHGGRKLAAKMENFVRSASPGSIKVSSQPFVFWSSRVLSLMGDNLVGNSSASGSVFPNYTYFVVVHDSRAPASVQIATEYDLGTDRWDYPCPSNAAIYILGAVYNKNREVVARFGDKYPCLSKSQNNYYRINTGYELEGEPGRQWVAIPSRFNTQIELRPGDYDVHVVVSDGHKFGQARMPLRVEPIDSQALTISDLVLNGTLRDASWILRDAGVVSPAPLVPTPLVSKNAQFIPVPDARLAKKSSLPLYFEIYEPLLADRGAEVYFRIKITCLKDGTVVINAGPTSAAECVIPGNVVIPIELNVATEKLQSGEYKLEIQASDSAGRTTEWRTAKFEIQ
jgi:hypothetical protein